MNKFSTKVRIALALEYPLLQQGGTEALVRELVLGLSEKFDLVLVSGDQDRKALGDVFGPLISEHLFWDKAKTSRDAAVRLAQSLIDRKIALAHFHSGGVYDWQSHKAWQSPIYYLTGQGVPCVVTSHLVPSFLEGFSDPDRPSWQKVLLLPKAWFSKMILLSRVRKEFLVSKHDQAKLQRYFPSFAAKMGQMYHSTRTRSSGRTPPQQRKRTIFCLGTFGQRKGQTILARAFASLAKRHPDWTLVLMGRTDTTGYWAMVQKIVVDSGISGQVLFPPSESDPICFLNESAIFAIPSLQEGLGLSLQEALYSGCACVGSKVGGIPELIENEKTGLLVPPGDESALASALERLISDPNLRTRLGQKAQQSIIEKGMLVEVMIENHIRLYESILSGEKT